MSEKVNTQSRSKSIQKWIESFFALIAVLSLSACTISDQADKTSCTADVDKRVTIAVTDVRPQVVIDQLARESDCAFTVSPFVWKHVTLQMEDATVAQVLASVCSQTGGKYILNGNHLAIKPYTFFNRLITKQGEQFNMEIEVQNTILQSRLPGRLNFEAVPLSSVLEEISKASGLEIKPWKDEGDRKVTLDVSGMTVNEAIKAVVRYVRGEGAVLIKHTYRFPTAYGQHWPWGSPPSY